MKKTVSLLLTLALLSMSVFALAADTVKIGGLAPLTGEVAQYGIAVKEGVDLFVEQFNAAGGVNGTPVEMIWYDEKGDVTEAINAYNRLVEGDNVVAIIGDVTSTPSLAVGDLAVEIGIPMITASSTNYFVTDGKPNYFRTCFLDPFQARTMANFALDEFEAQKVAVIYDVASDYNLGLAESFVEQAEANGQEVVAYEAGTANDVDFKAQLTNIAAKEPDVLFVAFYYTEAALITTQAAEMGLKVPFLGADGIVGIENTIDDVALLDNAIFFTSGYAPDATTDATLAFINDFTGKYGKAPYSMFNATAYEAALVMCEAIKAAESLEYADIVAAMKATDVESVTGRITFDDHNDPIKSAYIMTFVDGQQVFIKQQNP